jgi:hypothetical protein
MSWNFRPAKSFTDRRGLFVGLIGGTNSGKTWSAMRLARGIAGPEGKIAVLDTEGGRTLHLAMDFDFDAEVMDPPFRPERFADAAKAVEDAGYACLLIDSFSMEWRGMGGVLDWQTAEYTRLGSREEMKLMSWAAPKQAHKMMVASLLQRRMPVVFAMRAEEKVYKAAGKIVKRWAPICEKEFPFELTVSFMLQADRKGVIDLSDPRTFKMEGHHRAIFRDGDQISEAHGAALAAWANGKAASVAVDPFHDAKDAAARGTKALQEWWGGVGRPHQRALKDRLGELKAVANAADDAGADGSEPDDPFAITQPKDTAKVDDPPFTPAGDAAWVQVSPETAGPAAGAQDGQQDAAPSGGDWPLLDADGWLAQVYALSDIIDACTNAKALSVIQAAPKFAEPYAAMKRHAPKSADAVDEMVKKRREALAP